HDPCAESQTVGASSSSRLSAAASSGEPGGLSALPTWRTHVYALVHGAKRERWSHSFACDGVDLGPVSSRDGSSRRRPSYARPPPRPRTLLRRPRRRSPDALSPSSTLLRGASCAPPP